MRRSWHVVMVVATGIGVVGCVKTQTRIVEVPRVDQELSGNRGYLQGSAPGVQARAPRRTTRQLIMTDIELPTREEIAPVKAELGPGNRGVVVREPMPSLAPAPVTPPVTPPAPAWTSAPPAPAPPREALPADEPRPSMTLSPPAPTTYTVRTGDTLEKIAKTVYGDATRWSRIYKANQGTLKNPNRLYPGQVLTIPPLASSEESPRRMRAHRESGPESLK